MRIPYIITGAALIAAFVIGCSQHSNPAPKVRFLGYKEQSDGGARKRAVFEFINPSQSVYVFQGRFEPGDVAAMTAVVQPGSTLQDVFFIRQTNTVALTVKAMKVDSVHELTVPMPDIVLEPTPTAP